jgi:hypothetical protein
MGALLMGMFDSMFENEEFKEKFDKIINDYTVDAFCQLYKYCKMLARDIDGAKYVNLKTLYYYIMANFDDVTLDDDFDSGLDGVIDNLDELIESDK